MKLVIPNAKGKPVEKTLIREASYTPDFHVTWMLTHPMVERITANLYAPITTPRPMYRQVFGSSLFEVKPIMFGRDGRGNAQKAISQVYRKWLYQRHGLFAQLVMIGATDKGWFAETFTPRRFLLTDRTRQPRKLNYPIRTLNEWLNTLPV